MNTEKSYSLELFRYLFMLIIALWHSNLKIFQHGYLPVEFFFILSGYLLLRSVEKHNIGTLQYTYIKFKRFMPQYLTALSILILINFHKWNTIVFWIERIPELFMIQCTGFYSGSLNSPLWYLSVLILGGGILHSLILRKKNIVIKVILPLFILSFYTYLFNQQDSLECWKEIGCFSIPLLRGLAAMSIGVILAYIHIYYNEKIDSKIIYWNISSILSLLLFLMIIFTKEFYDKYVIILVPPIIIVCMSTKSWFNKWLTSPFFGWLGSLSFSMLVIHIIFNKIFHKMSSFLPEYTHVILYIIGLTIASYVFKKSCSTISKKFKVT